MSKVLEPDREIQLQSAILGLQVASIRHAKAVNNLLRWMGYNSNGDFYVLEGYRKMAENVKECADDVVRRNNIVCVLKGECE